MEYKLLLCNNPQDLVNDVTKSIAEGWEPLGNPTFVTKLNRAMDGAPYGGQFMQAMIKKVTVDY